ncbi:MAG TPA: hypothetical protein VHB97_25775 [Polyangia bacterium]|nr:hypothetical protein [Polyangia bacterium]
MDQEHGRSRLVDGIKEGLALDAIAAGEVTNVRQRMARAIQIMSYRGIDAPQTNTGSLQHAREAAKV